MINAYREANIPMRYDTVIYDLDGTLLNTLDDLANAVNHAMQEGGYPLHSVAQVCAMVGNGMEMLIRRALPQSAKQDEAAFERTLAGFKAYYALHANDCTRPYPGIVEMLGELKEMGVKQAVVSNKGDPFVKQLCAEIFGDVLCAAVGEQTGVRRKPAPDSLLKVMADLGCRPQSTLYVGDSDVDVETARNAGVDCACVCWGFRTEEQLKAAGGQVFAHQAQDIINLVKG